MARIGFLTCASLEKYDFSPDFPNLLRDDILLKNELERRGHTVTPIVWDQVTPGELKADLVFIRTPWDYLQKAEAFLQWLAAAEAAGTPLQNPARLVRWNLSKTYLLELQKKGVATIPTLSLDGNAEDALKRAFQAFKTERVVVKPLVGASAYRTALLTRGQVPEFLAGTFRQWKNDSRFLVQPFLQEVEIEGEWSLIFFGEDFSHSLRKTPAQGDFRVQELYGGASRAEAAPACAIEAATKVFSLLPVPPFYMRLDGIVRENVFLVMELELFEPELFFRADPASAGRCADRVEAALAR
ncbi:MAG TPA: hypothetical protein VD713_01440 [Sphingomonadales bacterium]|nr:hypothetical protein [Sphingomonadales bacterium]